MSKTTTRVLAGVAVAALAATGVAAVLRDRQGRRAPADERAHLDELQVRLTEAVAPGDLQPARVRRVVESLQRNHGISAAQLLRWITALRHGTLSPEQATVAESDFAALEREADQSGA
jgi:transposase-like protein